MDQVHKLARQAYSQAPWRSQTQWMGYFLLVVVVTALVAFIYLNTTAQAATYGRQIQEMQVNIYFPQTSIIAEADKQLQPPTGQEEEDVASIEELNIEIADLEGKLALLTTQDIVDEKAKELDMQPNDPAQTMFLVVPGYQGPEQVHLAPPPRLERLTAPALPDVYKQSLVDWLKQQVVQTSHMFMEEVSK